MLFAFGECEVTLLCYVLECQVFKYRNAINFANT